MTTNPYEEFIRHNMERAVAMSTPSKVVEPYVKPEVTGDPILTALDRCDCKDCGSRAYVRVSLLAGDLLFCAHHFNEVEATMKTAAYLIIDERWVLQTAEHPQSRAQGEDHA